MKETVSMSAEQQREEEEAAVLASPHRRGRTRVREVSSRFMSPLVVSNSNTASESQRSKSRQRPEFQEGDRNFPETARSSLDSTPLPKKHQHQHRGKPPSSVVNKENDARSSEVQQVRSSGRVISRPDTPIVKPTADRIVPSRYRQAFTHHRSTPAAKLLQDATAVVDPEVNDDAKSFIVQDNKISHHLSNQGNSRIMRSSMSEVDHNQRWHAPSPSPCSRSLSLPQLNNQGSSWISLTTDSEVTVTSYTPPNSKPFVKKNHQVGVGSFCLPPHPDATRKGRKLLFNYQEDVHSFKLLYNHYLQWRFTNAKAEASMVSQKMDIERQLYSLGVEMFDMRDSVKRRRIELQMLRRIYTSSTIAEYQMPYLEEWSAMEENYSTSLCAVIDALRNLSLRLPVSGGVKIGVTELGEILDSAEKLIEMIVSQFQSYMEKAEEVESLTGEIARVMGRESAHIRECGDSLLKVYASQVEECSLRGHLIQLQSQHFLGS